VDVHTTLKQSEDVTFQTVAGEAVLIRLDTGTYFSLNHVATQFWEMLDGKQSIGEQASMLATAYEVDVETVTRDLLELARQLEDEQLVVMA
jgi:hypothetical protein